MPGREPEISKLAKRDMSRFMDISQVMKSQKYK